MVDDLKDGFPDPAFMSQAHERVLVVEDEQPLRELADRVLSRSGYEVLTCRNLQEAFTLYEKEEGRFDLLISDVVLPDGNGVELAACLKERDPSLSVLLTSGYNEIISKWDPFRQLGAPFLKKPFRVLELLQFVRQALDQQKESGP